MPTERPSEQQIDAGEPPQSKLRARFSRLRPRKTDEAEKKVRNSYVYVVTVVCTAAMNSGDMSLLIHCV